MTIDKKFGVGFLFVCGMVVSGCLGYSIKDTQHKDRMEIVAQYNAQQSSCSRMMQQLSNYSTKEIKRKPSPKELAIIRMQRD
ncbi:MAG: hypothetical protein RLZZ64_1454 [Bacteroidota bacterium]|jgi:hypothetical protein